MNEVNAKKAKGKILDGRLTGKEIPHNFKGGSTVDKIKKLLRISKWKKSNEAACAKMEERLALNMQ